MMLTKANSGAGALRRLTNALAVLLKAFLVACAAIMLFAITVQVVMRYVFNYAPPWSEELALLVFSWATIGGLALGVREGFHVRLTLLLTPLPLTARGLAERIISLVTAVLGFYLAWSGWRFLDITSGSVSAAIEYPIEFLNISAPIAGALIFIFALEQVFWPLVLPDTEIV
jgi:TRAP-type C4-dicarboxylate transport system permease small subunit